MHLCLKLLCAKAFCACFLVQETSLWQLRAFWRAEQLRWVGTNFEEMRKFDQCSDEMKTTYLDGMRWEEMRWGEKRWEGLTYGSHNLRWDEVWSVKCKCEVRSVKRALWSVKKLVASRWIAPRPRAGHVLGQQQRNRFAQSTHARAWLAHSACKFYRWVRSYSITLRQLPPRLVRVLLVMVNSG